MPSVALRHAIGCLVVLAICNAPTSHAVDRTPTAGLAPAGPEITVRATSGGVAGNGQVAVFADDSFVVVWTSAGTSGGTTVLHARTFLASGAASSGELSLVKPFNQRVNGVAATSDGGFVVVWEQGSLRGRTQVLARKFTHSGTPVTGPLQVSEPSPLSRFPGVVAGTADGGFAAAWASDNPNGAVDAYARVFRADGAAVGPSFLVAPGFAGDRSEVIPTAIAVRPDGSLAILSECLCDSTNPELQIFSRAGTKLLDLTSDLPGDVAHDPALGMQPDGGLIVAWSDGGFLSSSIMAQRFGPDGAARGGPFRVSARGSAHGDAHGSREVSPKLAVLDDGSFLAVWSDASGRDGSGYGVFARSFDATGNPVGSDFRINLTRAGDQFATAAAASGEVVTVWTQVPNQIKARILRPQ